MSSASSTSPICSRALGHRTADDRFGVVALELRLDEPGRDDGDAHVRVERLLAQRLREGMHAELGHVVDGGAGVGAAARHRGHVHDVPSPVLGDQRQGGVGADQQAPEVDVEHPAPVRRVGRRDRAEQHQAGVVDEHVEGAELGRGVVNEAGRLLLVGDVDGADERRALEALGESVEALARRAHTATAAPASDRARARRLADPGGGPCHDRYTDHQADPPSAGMLPRYAPRAQGQLELEAAVWVVSRDPNSSRRRASR